MKLLVTILALISLYGCDELTGASTGANDVSDNKTIGGIPYVDLKRGKILLNGTIDNGGNASHNFELKLKLQEGKSASFYFFANRPLNRGIKLTLLKIGPEATIELVINGISHSIKKALASDNTIHLSLDIHNDHEDAHILIWDGAGPYGDSEECVEEETCIYNTEFFTDPNPGPWGNQGKGPGSFWGFEGMKDMVLELIGPETPLSNV